MQQRFNPDEIRATKISLGRLGRLGRQRRGERREILRADIPRDREGGKGKRSFYPARFGLSS